jgi:hypothetical protein
MQVPHRSNRATRGDHLIGIDVDAEGTAGKVRRIVFERLNKAPQWIAHGQASLRLHPSMCVRSLRRLRLLHDDDGLALGQPTRFKVADEPDAFFQVGGVADRDAEFTSRGELDDLL